MDGHTCLKSVLMMVTTTVTTSMVMIVMMVMSIMTMLTMFIFHVCLFLQGVCDSTSCDKYNLDPGLAFGQHSVIRVYSRGVQFPTAAYMLYIPSGHLLVEN